MKTLVIHPEDRTTEFLNQIYRGRDWTVVTDRKILQSETKIRKLIENHDRIIMMGHGSYSGLFFTAINSRMGQLLGEKECVCIWCNADQYVRQHNLKGFHTGMFISEVLEGMWFGITSTQEEIDYSNQLFTKLVTDYIDDDNIMEIIKTNYVGDCPVIRFNNSRLYDTKILITT